MRVEYRDGTRERKVLIGMLVNTQVCGHIAARWQPQGLFRSPWANIVGELATKHYHTYGKAPGKDVEAEFEAWSAKNPDPTSIALVERFLTDLSGEYTSQAEEVNTKLILDLAGEHFNRIRLERTHDKLGSLLQADEVADADTTLVQATTQRINLGKRAYVDPFQDWEFISSLVNWEEEQKPLIEYPGELGRFFGMDLDRGGFVAFLAPTGVGKSFWLLDLAYRAMRQRRKVAFFLVGDMTKEQWGQRLASRAALHPFHSASWPVTVPYPSDLFYENDNAKVKHQAKVFKKPMTRKFIWDACQDVCTIVRSRKSYLRLEATSATSVLGIRESLREWELEDYVPDVVVVDYADNLTPIDMKEEPRDRINTTWRHLRMLALDLNCLVATATQANREGFGVHLLKKENVADDRRKVDHLTALYGINVTPEEEDKGQCRLNKPKVREGAPSQRKVVHVAGALAMAHPAVLSI